MTESSHMVGIRGSFDPVLIPFSSFSPFSILGGPQEYLRLRSPVVAHNSGECRTGEPLLLLRFWTRVLRDAEADAIKGGGGGRSLAQFSDNPPDKNRHRGK